MNQIYSTVFVYFPMNRWDIHVGVRISFGLSFVDSQGEPEARTADAAEFIVCVQEV